MPVALITAGLAALLHVYIFVMESVLWTTPRVRATFGISSDAQAEHTRLLAFNQGFYNLFLAIVTGAGIVTWLVGSASGSTSSSTGATSAGIALVIAGTGSMLGAALVLLFSDRTKLRAAVVQGVFPLITLLVLAITAIIG